MKLKIDVMNIGWWFWTITTAFIIAAVAGWTPGYYVVMGISAVQILFFLLQEKNLVSFPVQVRMVYFGVTLFGLWPDGRLVVYIILLLGTAMEVLFGRCGIALALKQMPWNREREAKHN